MFTMPKTITYALPEQIGNTNLFVGRKKEFDYFLGDWYYWLTILSSLFSYLSNDESSKEYYGPALAVK